MNAGTVQIFENPSFGKIRSMVIDDSPWFVAKDVAERLGYTNPQKAVRDHVYEEDLIMGERNVTPSIIDGAGRIQYPTWVNESGTYALIFGSKLPKAKEFKHWVTFEVLPTIRKMGSYSVNPKAKAESLAQFSLLAGAVADLQTRMLELTSVVNLVSSKIDMLFGPTETPQTSPVKPDKTQFDKRLVKNETLPQKPLAVSEAKPPESKPQQCHSSLYLAVMEHGIPDVAPPKKKNVPQTHESKAQSPWRHEVYELAKPTCRRMDINISALFSKIYHKMNVEYSWVFGEERKDFVRRNGDIPNTSVIDIVEDSPRYRDIFMSILRDMYENAKTPAVQKALPSPVSVANAVMGKELEAADTAVIPVTIAPADIHPARPVKADPDHDYHDDFISASRALVEQLAAERGDTTKAKAWTYRRVYDAIGETEMARIRNSYQHSFGKPKGAAINMFNTKNRYDKLYRAVNSIRTAI